MALVFADGFDTYTTVDQRWATAGLYTKEIRATSGRNGRGCFFGDAGYLYRDVPAASGYKLGLAFKGERGGGTAALCGIGLGGNLMVSVVYEADGTFKLYHPQTASTIATGTVVIAEYQWCYLELKVTSTPSTVAGDVELRVNGTLDIAGPTGFSTRWASGTTVDRVVVGSVSGAINRFDAYIDDVVLLALADDYWGDVTVEGRLPSGAGAYSAFAATGAATNWQAVSDADPDGDTSYASTWDAQARDSYVFGGLLQSPAIVRGVQVSFDAKKTGNGGVGLSPFFRQGGVDYDGTKVDLGTSYATSQTIFALNPATGAAWTPSEVGALEAGIKLTS